MKNLHFYDIQLAPQSAAQVEDAAIQLERDFVDIVREEIGMNEQLAGIFAQALVRGLRRRMGGTELWVPAPDKAERNAAIRREFTGTRESLRDVMRRHNVSRSTVYEVCASRGANSPVSPLQTGQPSA